MSDQTIIPVPALELSNLTDDEVLAYTRGVRIKAVSDVMKTGIPPQETSDRIFLTNMLNGLDSQAMNSKRIIADKDIADTSAATIAAILGGIDKQKIFTGDATTVEFNESRVMLPSTDGVPETVPGEMSMLLPQMDYGTFMRSQGKDADSLGSNAEAPDPSEHEEF